jgi:hypothetical protein
MSVGYWLGKTRPLVSEETKEKLSRALRGRVSPNKGKHFTQEHRFKIGQALKGRHASEETN